jgi:hypothetical protein
MNTHLTIPSLTPILDAVRAVRGHYLPDVASWAADILAGDEHTLVAGRELMTAVSRLHDELEQLAGPFDAGLCERLVGVDQVVTATLIATGEIPSDDPEVHERFRPVRLEHARRQAEQLIERHEHDPDAAELVAQCRGDLALIAAGIEPA